jgi:uncharacterized SAM-binding protein YcdF (DUF218 family)
VNADGAPADAAAAFPSRGRRAWRITWRALVALGAIAAVYYLVSFAQVWRTGERDEARPVDAIVVLGAAQYDGRPSPQLEARLEHVLALWEAGVARHIGVTGGNQPGDRFTEAGTSAAWLVDRGVPESAILQETTGRSSWESLANLDPQLRERGVDRVVLVSDPFHMLRLRLSAEELGYTAFTSPTRTSPVGGGEEVVQRAKEAAGVAVGRVIGFERLWRLTG